MYKLYKLFNSIAKQAVKSKEKSGGTSNVRRDTAILEKEYAPLNLSVQVKDSINLFKVCTYVHGPKVLYNFCVIYFLQECLPVIHILCNPGLRPRHWDKINAVIGYSISPDSGTSLRKMLKHNLEPYLEQFEAISTAASKEHSLEKAMQRMEDDWDEVIFNTTLYRDTGMYAYVCVYYVYMCMYVRMYSMYVHV